MKLAVNTVIFGLNQAVAEALVLAERAGIRSELAYDVITASAAGAPYVGYKRAAFLDPEGTPTSFALELAAKDLGLIADLAASVGLRLPQAAIDHQVIQATIAAGRGDSDLATVAEHVRHKRPSEEGATG
jgi:3-hydroxyisobutyrate dehydrogenase-like beta-hydroxyacid dehydrogenase